MESIQALIQGLLNSTIGLVILCSVIVSFLVETIKSGIKKQDELDGVKKNRSTQYRIIASVTTILILLAFVLLGYINSFKQYVGTALLVYGVQLAIGDSIVAVLREKLKGTKQDG